MRSLLALVCLSLVPVTAGATLIGDTITVVQAVDSGGGLTDQGSGIDILVAAGTSDATMVGGSSSFPHTFDAEASFFTLLQASTGWSGDPPFSFNGYRIHGLDWVGLPGHFISGVSVTSNIGGFSDDRVTFSDHEVLINFGGLSVNNGQVTVTLTTTAPEPGTTLLLGTGLLALASVRRRG